jgi:predicted Zn-dependent protease
MLMATSLLPCYGEGENDPLWNRPSYSRKVILIGKRLLERNHITENIQFVVQSDELVNAGATDSDATVVVFTGLLKIIENDDELAFVMGHEIGHILKRHGLKANVTGKVLGTTLGVLSILAMGDDKDGMAVGQMVNQKVENQTHRFMNGQELQADATGLDLMVGAGYDPWAGYRISEKIASDGYLMRFMRSHPNGKTRLARLENQIKTKYPSAKRYPNVSEPLKPADPNQPQAVPFYIQQ